MSTFALQRCLHHLEREAVARCTSCTQHFCRECIVEHDGRVICSECRGKLLQKSGTTISIGKRLGTWSMWRSIFVFWFCIYLFGKTLLLIPSSFHEGDVWKDLPAEQ